MIPYRCEKCESTHILPTLTWEADDDPYISRKECLACGDVVETRKPKKVRSSRDRSINARSSGDGNSCT